MSIVTGQTIAVADFINKSEKNATPSNDSNRVAKLQDDAMIHPAFIGNALLTDGSDGDLTVTSGATNIDLGSAQIVVKNYADISITGTGSITFTNPHANGTTIIFLCRKFTCTSSASPAINASAIGAAGGASVSTSSANASVDGNAGNKAYGFTNYIIDNGDGATSGGVGAGGVIDNTTFNSNRVIGLLAGLLNWFSPGAGAGSGSIKTDSGTTLRTSGVGGRGGGALAIICSGEWNFTATISVAGENGGDQSGASGVGSGDGVGGGGGGGGGSFLGWFRRQIANSGTITKTGGVGGLGNSNSVGAFPAYGGGGGASSKENGDTGGSVSSGGASGKTGGDGGDGYSLTTTNTGSAT